MRGQPPQDVKDSSRSRRFTLTLRIAKKRTGQATSSTTLYRRRRSSPTRVDTSRLAHPAKIFVQHGGDLRLCGGRHIGLIPEGAASPLLASGMLVRTGLIEIPVRYWMFALRERDIDLLAAYVARVAGAVANRGARLLRLNRCNPKILPKTENSGDDPHDTRRFGASACYSRAAALMRRRSPTQRSNKVVRAA